IIIVDTLNKFFSVFDDVFEEDIRSTVTCNSNKIQKCRNYKVLFVKSKIPDFRNTSLLLALCTCMHFEFSPIIDCLFPIIIMELNYTSNIFTLAICIQQRTSLDFQSR
ncbi:hypothetical protein T10_3436, partial [Trichinella papuae]